MTADLKVGPYLHANGIRPTDVNDVSRWVKRIARERSITIREALIVWKRTAKLYGMQSS